MRYIDEYRDLDSAQRYIELIKRITTQPWVIMEICGGQTHSIVKYGIDELLPKTITLVHGPGCPVCVTPVELINKAIAIAEMPNTILCAFGDMIRVPGSDKNLYLTKAEGGDVRIVYSPMDAVGIAQANPDKEVVFFSVGFETTAPGTALAIFHAHKENIRNFSSLVSHVLVPPAIEAILSSPTNQVQGFLAAGHVCAVMGYHEYPPLSAKYKTPIVVAGFEPLDILQALAMVVKQLENGLCETENQYTRVVTYEGNAHAQNLLKEVYTTVDQQWRGIGVIPNSGLALKSKYADFDANKRFNMQNISCKESSKCISGLILQGVKSPLDCPVFGTECTPESPLGATMVSSEGACAAYFKYRKRKSE